MQNFNSKIATVSRSCVARAPTLCASGLYEVGSQVFFSEILLNVIVISSNERPPFQSLKVLICLVKKSQKKLKPLSLVVENMDLQATLTCANVHSNWTRASEPKHEYHRYIDDSLEKLAPMKYRCI